MEWKNLDTLTSFEELSKVAEVDLTKVMSGENGAERVKKYSTPMAEGLAYNYAAKKVDDSTLAALAKLAEEAQLSEKFAALYNGEVVNTGEKRLVLFMENSRIELLILQTRYMPERSQMQRVKSLQL